jgi:hypothetical protein
VSEQAVSVSTSPYSVVILTPGPEHDSDVADSELLVQWLNNFAAPAGRLPALMEVDDNPLISGIAVVPVDAQAAATILAADPAVVSGRFAFEVHPAEGFPG